MYKHITLSSTQIRCIGACSSHLRLRLPCTPSVVASLAPLSSTLICFQHVDSPSSSVVMTFSPPQAVPRSALVLLTLLSYVLLGVLPKAGCVAQQALSFSVSTPAAPWSIRALAFSTAVGGSGGLLPFIAGGSRSTGLVDPYKGVTATSYFNDVYVAADSAGKNWMQVTAAAQWSKRSSGLIDVIVAGSPIQILVLIGGRKAAGDGGLLNDVWSSLDVTRRGTCPPSTSSSLHVRTLASSSQTALTTPALYTPTWWAATASQRGAAQRQP